MAEDTLDTIRYRPLVAVLHPLVELGHRHTAVIRPEAALLLITAVPVDRIAQILLLEAVVVQLGYDSNANLGLHKNLVLGHGNGIASIICRLEHRQMLHWHHK